MTDAADIRAALARAVDGPLTVDITTTGRASGETRRIEIWVVGVDDDIVIGGTPGPRDWFANLRVNPNLVVHLKDDVVADVAATAHDVIDPEHRRRIWTAPSTRWYRQRTPVDDLVADAPTVIVAPRDH